MPNRKITVRSARLNSLDDKKFLAVHGIFKKEYQEKMEAVGYDTFHDWTFADTVTRMVRETFDRLDAGNHPINAELFPKEGELK